MSLLFALLVPVPDAASGETCTVADARVFAPSAAGGLRCGPNLVDRIPYAEWPAEAYVLVRFTQTVTVTQ